MPPPKICHPRLQRTQPTGKSTTETPLTTHKSTDIETTGYDVNNVAMTIFKSLGHQSNVFKIIPAYDVTSESCALKRIFVHGFNGVL